jgi:hypothetical protein
MTTGTAELPTVGGGGEQAGTVVEKPPTEPPAAPPAAPIEAAAEPPAEPPAEPEPPAATTDDKEPDRFRYKDPTDRAINALKKARDTAGTPISWAEAERLVKGEAPAPPAPPAPAGPELTEVVGTLETEVAEIQRQLKEAGANEGLFDEAIAQLQIDLADKVGDLKLAKRDLAIQAEVQAEDARTVAEESKNLRATAKARAIELYPAAADVATPLGKAVADRIAAMKNPNHPDHAILYADSAPLTIVRDVAAELGVQPAAGAAPAAPPVTPPVVPPKSKMTPASGGKTSVSAPQTEGDAKKYVEHLRTGNATLEELDAVFEPGGTQQTLQSVVGR